MRLKATGIGILGMGGAVESIAHIGEIAERVLKAANRGDGQISWHSMKRTSLPNLPVLRVLGLSEL